MDEDLLAAAADLLPALAASMGPDAYAPHFLAAHAEPLLNRLKPQQPLPLRAIAAGAAAEVAEVLGTYMGGVVALALPLLLRELQADVSEAWSGNGGDHVVSARVHVAGRQVLACLLPARLGAVHHDDVAYAVNIFTTRDF